MEHFGMGEKKIICSKISDMNNTPPLALPIPNSQAFKCPHCDCYSTMQYKEVQFADDQKYIEKGNKRFENKITIARCNYCGQKIIWNECGYIYPDVPPAPATSDMPLSVKELYDEAGAIFRKSPRAACALLRLAVERLCNELGENKRKLDDNIANLAKRGLSTDIIKQMDILRVVGNKAVHPGYIELDVNNVYIAYELMRLLNSLVRNLITEKRQTDFLYGKLPESKRRINE